MRTKLKTIKLKKDDLIMLTFISHTLIRLSDLVDGPILMVFTCVPVYMSAAGADSVRGYQVASLHTISLSHIHHCLTNHVGAINA